MATTADPSPLAQHTAFQRDLLALIEEYENAEESPPHGLALKSRLEAAWDVDEIHHGRLYPNLDELVESGLVEKGKRDDRTNTYSLTDRGRAALDADRAWRSS